MSNNPTPSPVVPNLHRYGNNPYTEGLILVNLSTNTERLDIAGRLKAMGLVAMWTCFCRYNLVESPRPGSSGVCFLLFASIEDKQHALRRIPRFLIWGYAANAQAPSTWVWQAREDVPMLDPSVIPNLISISTLSVELFVGGLPYMEGGVACQERIRELFWFLLL